MNPKRFLSMALAATTMFSLCLTAFASSGAGNTALADQNTASDATVFLGYLEDDEADAALTVMDTEESESQSVYGERDLDSVPDATIILGNLEDDEGSTALTVRGPEEETGFDSMDDSMLYKSISSSFLFSAEANNVKNLVTTMATDKIITKSSLKGDIRVSGTLQYSPTPSESESRAIRGGLCTYNAASGVFDTKPNLYILFENGVRTSKLLSKSALQADTKYYGFVKNLIGDYVYKVNGTLYYYDEYEY